MRVRDLSSGGAPPTVEIETGSAYELLVSLYAFSSTDDRDVYEVGPAWFEGIRTTAPAGLLATIEEGRESLGGVWLHLAGLASESAPPRDAEAFLALVEATPALELRLHPLGYYQPTPYHDLPRERLLQAAQGDPAAIDEYIGSVGHGGEEHASLRTLLARGPEEFKGQVLGILRGWYEAVFRAQEPELMAAVRRDAEAKGRLLGRLAPERLIEVATNGVQYTPQAGIRRVLLIPSVLLRPWIVVLEHRDAKIIFYSVAEESLTPERAPAHARLSKLYKALADERRLQILKELATESHTLQELADTLGMGKSLAHHHLVALRAAGLVRVSSSPDKRYSLREETIAGVGEGLAGYLAVQARREPGRARRASRPPREE